MGSFGSFYKGEKKKPKKKENNVQNVSVSTRPVFTAPKLVDKKKKGDW